MIFKNKLQKELTNSGFIINKDNIFNIDESSLLEFDKIAKNKSLKNHDEGESVKIIENTADSKLVYALKFKIDIFLKKNFKNIYNKISFENVWAQTSNIQTYQKNELPFIPHLDYLRKFKIMIYLSNVNRNDGPIHLHKCHINKFEKLRLSLKKDYKEKKLNAISTFKIENYESCTGGVGTTIFFDTNCPHFAGEIQENFTPRKILRFNYLYKVSFFNSIIKKVFN